MSVISIEREKEYLADNQWNDCEEYAVEMISSDH